MDMTINVKQKPGEKCRALLRCEDLQCEVLIGKNGVISAKDKREGDGCSPAGKWRVLYGLYRADRVEKIAGKLVWQELRPDMGWCDEANDPLYNRPVPLGYPASHEAMWRDDSAYDYVLVLDHNQGAIEPGAGSAVFVHLWREGASYTAGCVALKKDDFVTLAEKLAWGAVVEIEGE